MNGCEARVGAPEHLFQAYFLVWLECLERQENLFWAYHLEFGMIISLGYGEPKMKNDEKWPYFDRAVLTNHIPKFRPLFTILNLSMSRYINEIPFRGAF